MGFLKCSLMILAVVVGGPVFGQPSQSPFYSKAALALEASKAGYLLPNLRTRVETKQYLEDFAEFSKATPRGYQIYGADADLRSGLKFVIYKPTLAGSDDPWILSLTGTETLIDWVNNTDLGWPQFRGLKKIVTLFTTNFVPDQELIITGHSLGGALAQAVAHEILKERIARGLNRKKISLITWNGFGAQELIGKFGDYNPHLSDQMEVANFFVRGDVVSQIGRHFGPTYELIPPTLAAGSKISATMQLHSLALIERLLSPASVQAAQQVSPPFAKTLNRLSEVSGLLAYLNGQIHEFRQLWLVRRLCVILDEIETTEQLQAQAQAYTYLYNVGFTEQIRLRAEKHPDKVHDYVHLKATLERFLALKSGAL